MSLLDSHGAPHIGIHRVCHITTVRIENDIRIFVKECRSLAALGMEVHLIVSSDGARDECVEGVHLHRLPRVRTRIARVSLTVARAAREAFRLRADLYHFHDPELMPLGLLFRLAGRKVIYDVHEDFPGTLLSKHYLPRWMRRPLHGLAHAFEQLAARCYNGMIVATPRIGEKFSADKTRVVNNFPILEEFAAPACIDYRLRPANVVYVGAISRARGIDLMLRGAARSSAQRFLLAGRFMESGLRERLESQPEWKRVDFRGWIDRAALAALLDQARVGLVLLRPEPNYVESQPIKLFEYMASGLPVVVSDFPYWRRFVCESEFGPCGVLVDPEDTRAVAAAIDRLLNDPDEAWAMGRNGLRAVRERFNWSHEVGALLDLYRRVAA